MQAERKEGNSSRRALRDDEIEKGTKSFFAAESPSMLKDETVLNE